MNEEKRLIYLLKQYADDIATSIELEELKSMLNNIQQEGILTASLARVMAETDDLPVHDEERLQAIWKAIREDELPLINKPSAKVKTMHKQNRWWAAAAIFILIGSSVYFLLSKETMPNELGVAKKKVQNDIAPGGNKAVLTLSDGSAIALDTATNGTITQQGNTNVTKLGNGQLVYSNIKAPMATVLFNTLTTPAGGQYKLMLPDGTNVWLNASSSITYPTTFVGERRDVSITGEAYFEVSHLQNKDGMRPFTVKIVTPKGDGGQVEVLGTHFNVNAYGDEPYIKTTLLQGSVKLSTASTSNLLKPGQQGLLAKKGSFDVFLMVEHADIEEAVAWKNGLFHFENADIKTVMRQVARWYDVEVEFKGNITTEKFAGEISRNSNISEVLRILEISNIHFKLEGKKITVLP